MQLKYHQATYELLTQDYIDPQPAIDLFEKYEAPHVLETNKPKMGEAAAQKKVDEWREYLLGWTRLKLHNRPVNFSSENIDKLDSLEKQYSIKLPSSVREWYSLDIAPEIMSVYKGGYPPLYEPIEKIRPLSEKDFDWGFSPRHDLWYFLISEYINQGGQEILFQVSTVDDPPVFALCDDEYIELASKFSEFIYRHFWVWHASYVFRYSFFLYYYDIMMPSRHFWVSTNHLRQNFSEVPDNKRLHFYNDTVRIFACHPMSVSSLGQLIPEDTTIVAGGSFHTKTLDGITDLIKSIWGNDAPLFNVHTHNKSVENIIKGLQYERVRQIISEKQVWVSDTELADTLHLQSVGTINAMKQVLNLLVEQTEIEEQVETTADANVKKRYRIRADSDAESEP